MTVLPFARWMTPDVAVYVGLAVTLVPLATVLAVTLRYVARPWSSRRRCGAAQASLAMPAGPQPGLLALPGAARERLSYRWMWSVSPSIEAL